MREIEPSEVPPRPELTARIREFWTRNVNAERLFGVPVTRHARGERRYFEDLEAQRYRSHRHLAAWIDAMQPGRSVLEIGCGIGLDAWRMARRGLRVTAIDLTDVGVATARRRFADEGVPARFACADAGRLPFPGDHFDYVYSFGVLHHAADTARCIDEVHRVLAPGSEAFVMLYHRRSLNELVHRLARVPFEERHELCPVVRRFTRAEARALFARFARVDVSVEHLFGEGYGMLFRATPAAIARALGRRFGWHLMIHAWK